MSDSEKTEVREQTEEVEILGVMVKPVMQSVQQTIIDAVIFRSKVDGVSDKIYKVGDTFTDAFGEEQTILRLKAQYADKTVALIYKTEDYKDAETGMTFTNEFMFVITGESYECQVHDEVIERMDRKGTIMAAKQEKANRLFDAQEKERLEKEASEKAAADEAAAAKESTADQDTVEPDEVQNTTDDVEQKPSESDGENS